MSPLSLTIFLLAALVFYFGVSGRLPGIWAALQGQGAH